MIKLNSIAEPEYINSTSLEAMNKAVEGRIQLFGEKDDMTVYCNEEGMILGLNPSAYIPDFLCHMGFEGACQHSAMIFGNVVISRDDKKLTKKQTEYIKNEYKVWRANVEAQEDDEDEEEKSESPPLKKKKGDE